MRQVLKRLQVPLPYELGFNATNNLYSGKGFLKFCEDYGVPHDPIGDRDKKFYWTYQQGVSWPDDYTGPDSMTCWIIEKSQRFTDMGLFRISESVKAYTYLILSLQASARLHIIGNMVSAFTALKAFLNNFENVLNHSVDILDDIKRCEDTLSYTSSKVDYSLGENIYIMPRDMNLKIKSGTAWYNNEILASDSAFSLGRNDMVITSVPEKTSYKTPIVPKHTPMPKHTTAITHEEEKIPLVLALTSAFRIWYAFNDEGHKMT